MREQGIDKDELKTVSTSASPKYRNIQKHGEWKEKFCGYKYSHILKLEFPIGMKMLNSLAKCKACPKISIEYTVENQEKAKKEILKAAVADAAGVKLGGIISMDYSWREVNMSVSSLNNFMDMMMLSEDYCDDYYDEDIKPDDIKLKDTVTIIWEIS